ncbi:MAG: Two-component, sigma54 specific, transcriptional regulator, Fis family [Deltaproteobacteria bacterium]|nr:Two-component, sigma54 specific, transcriptional regulator, Fis family [Deltaproteobacteria bacterium]
MIRVLVVDGEMANCARFAEAALRLGYELTSRHSLHDCLEAIASNSPDIIFIDSDLPDGDPIGDLDRIQRCSSSPTVIVMTARGTPEDAERAIRNGAWDYIQKPAALKEAISRLSRAIQYRGEFKNGNRKTEIKRNGIIGNSPVMRGSMDMVKQAAESDLNVLIEGETGTGKELFALSIHNNSKRANENFVVVDCTALPETLVESILFGHSKGAFTGADKAQEGLIRQAHKGTLFLDEMGELPLSLQKTFLRVLQEHHFRPLGSEKEVESDFRLISATNKNLEQMVEEGKFRGDLLYRLNAMTIHLPPLRQHLEDIADMTAFYVEKVCQRFGVQQKKISDEFLKYLAKCDWPGNVRELFHVIEHACAASLHEETLFPVHLPQELRIQITKSLFREDHPIAHKGNNGKEQAGSQQFLSLKRFRQSTYSDLEEMYLRNLLSSSGDIKEACMLSKLSRTRLYGLLKKYNIRNGA